jgi:uncharacterized MAPEG superfamily protein
LAGGEARVGIPLFAVFVAARLTHSVFYLQGRQPGRTIAFAASLLTLIDLIMALALALVGVRA